MSVKKLIKKLKLSNEIVIKVNEIINQIPLTYDIALQTCTIIIYMDEKNKHKSWYNDLILYPCHVYDIIKQSKKYIFEYKKYKCCMLRLYLSWVAIIDISHLRYMVIDDENCINLDFLNDLIDCDKDLNIINDRKGVITISYIDRDDVDIFNDDDFDEEGQYSYKKYADVKKELYSVIDQFIYLFNC